MKTKILLLFFLCSLTFLSAQKQYVLGNVKNEAQDNIPQTYIYNTRTEELTQTDVSGNFIIAAIPTDEIRVVKSGFERAFVKIVTQNFTQPLQLILSKLPFDIEEVTIVFQPSGNLKKDLAYFKTSAKTEKLNTELTNYAMGSMTEVIPQNKIPSMFAPKNLNQGQISLLGIGEGAGGLLNLLGKAISGKKTNSSPPNYAQVEDFYRRVKGVIDLDYFKSYGISDYDFDIFLAYVDQSNSLAKKYHQNFNKFEIESELKIALVEYLKTHKIGS
jgi:hypothetical protein